MLASLVLVRAPRYYTPPPDENMLKNKLRVVQDARHQSQKHISKRQTSFSAKPDHDCWIQATRRHTKGSRDLVIKGNDPKSWHPSQIEYGWKSPEMQALVPGVLRNPIPNSDLLKNARRRQKLLKTKRWLGIGSEPGSGLQRVRASRTHNRNAVAPDGKRSNVLISDQDPMNSVARPFEFATTCSPARDYIAAGWAQKPATRENN